MKNYKEFLEQVSAKEQELVRKERVQQQNQDRAKRDAQIAADREDQRQQQQQQREAEAEQRRQEAKDRQMKALQQRIQQLEKQ